MTDYSKLPDRELDALVAERVMGWLHVPVGNPPQLAWLSSKWSSIIEDGPPHFSTDANAALEAAKRAEVQSIILQLTIAGDDGWYAASMFANHLILSAEVVNKSPARAICEAILQATEPE